MAGEDGAECGLRDGGVVVVFIGVRSAESETELFGVEANSLVDRERLELRDDLPG